MKMNECVICNCLKKDLERYKKAYNILMDYWDSIPDQDKKEVDQELKKLGL